MKRSLSFCAALLISALPAHALPGLGNSDPNTLINGKVVDAKEYPHILRIRTGRSGCTATLVSKNVLLTAAHCAEPGAVTEFTLDGVTYQAELERSPLYGRRDHDVALGVIRQMITSVKPAYIGGKAEKGGRVSIFGYGCTQWRGEVDGKLRTGESVIVGFSNLDMVTRTARGSAVCSGDSGGPTFTNGGTGLFVLGVNSKGDGETSYLNRTDTPESISFFQKFASDHHVEICGITANCEGGTPPPPPPPALSCELTASPKTVKLGQNVTLQLSGKGNLQRATIDDEPVSIPNGKRTARMDKVGTMTSVGKVFDASGKSATCTTDYVVEEEPVTPPPPPPPGPAPFVLVPSYCGDNILTASPVRRVCVAVIRKVEGTADTPLPEVIVLTLKDNSNEILPILTRKMRGNGTGNLRNYEDLILYGNGAFPKEGSLALVTRTALLVRSVVDGQRPVAIEGKSIQNQYYVVEELRPSGNFTAYH